VIVLTLLNVLGVVLGKTAQISDGRQGPGPSRVVWRFHGDANGRPGQHGAGVRDDLAEVRLRYGVPHASLTAADDAAFVAAEVRQRRDISRALILGTLGITTIYLLVNAAYLWALGFDSARQSEAIATESVRATLGEHAGQQLPRSS